jgi:AraC-like DNA-binding protein
MRTTAYRSIRFGVDTLEPGIVLPRHRHTLGYATVVLSGSFEEASFAGRFAARPGDVLLHGAFDCHANRALSRQPLQIIRLPWRDNHQEGHFRVRDPDALARCAERDIAVAEAQLRRDLMPAAAGAAHWTERLAHALRSGERVRLDEWADSESLAPETVSRGFTRTFGVTPRAFRLEARARRAWNAILTSTAPVTVIAYDLGFADPAHLSRAVRALTGAPPSRWRAWTLALM